MVRGEFGVLYRLEEKEPDAGRATGRPKLIPNSAHGVLEGIRVAGILGRSSFKQQ